eukprot:156615-Pyramimonas_sp.AAC.1
MSGDIRSVQFHRCVVQRPPGDPENFPRPGSFAEADFWHSWRWPTTSGSRKLATTGRFGISVPSYLSWRLGQIREGSPA